MKSFLLLSVVVVLAGCVNTAVWIGCHLDTPVNEKPEEKIGKFAFTVEYQYQGGTHILEDMGRCEYLGRACDGRGLHNEWAFSLESGAEKLRPTAVESELALYFPTGGCQTLMAGEILPLNVGVSVDPFRGPASEWDPIGTQDKIDALGIEVIKFEIKSLNKASQ